MGATINSRTETDGNLESRLKRKGHTISGSTLNRENPLTQSLFGKNANQALLAFAGFETK